MKKKKSRLTPTPSELGQKINRYQDEPTRLVITKTGGLLVRKKKRW